MVLGAGLGELVSDESLVDRQDREWVDLPVGVGQIGPAVVTV
jgi:hypothetical protein